MQYLLFATTVFAQETNALLENRGLRAALNLSSGAITLLDKQTGASWELGAPEVVLKSGSTAGLQPLRLTQRDRNTLRYRREGIGEFSLSLLANPARLDYSVVPEEGAKELRLLSKALPVGPGDKNYYAAPIPDGDPIAPRRRQDRSAAVSGCTMAMFGAVKEGFRPVGHLDGPVH